LHKAKILEEPTFGFSFFVSLYGVAPLYYFVYARLGMQMDFGLSTKKGSCKLSPNFLSQELYQNLTPVLPDPLK